MKRHKHSLSHYRLMTGDMGLLYPVGCVEVLPGDTFNHQTAALIRLSPLLAPVMHPVHVRIHHFFVPNRLVWSGAVTDSWEGFITGNDTAATNYPTITLSSPTVNSLSTYLGVPPTNGLEIGALPIRCYNAIYNEHFRDQDLVSEVSEDTNTVQRIAWEKDYYSGARPWVQKGTAVSIPLGTSAPVVTTGDNIEWDGSGSMNDIEMHAISGSANVQMASAPAGTEVLRFGSTTGLETDLSGASGLDIVAFRQAFALSRYQEARARYGSRYTEYLAYCGIRSSDARLQRPEYLAGGRQTLSFSEVLQSSPDSGTSTVTGELRGHGIAALRSNRYRRFFEEHGHVITLLSVRPKVIYQDTVHRKWLRRDPEDYFQKELQNVGAQEIDEVEVYSAGTPGTVFGYADRYREYREEPSLVAGDFRSSTLDFWHMARQLGSAPTLNQSFIECNPDKRIHAVETDDVLWTMVNHSLQARRMVSRIARTALA